MPLISVVMPVYNSERFLAQAIESILAQTFTDFEFIIVDDCSQDRSVEIIQSYQKRDGRVRLIKLERNVGKANARNQGMKASSGEYISVMDSDDVRLPQSLSKQVAFMEANPDIGVLGACAQAVNQDLQPMYPMEAPLDHPAIALSLFVQRPFRHSVVLMRRELCLSVGGYEPSRRKGDDIELYTRLVWQTRFANLPECLLLVRHHPNQTQRDIYPKEREEQRLSRERFLKRLWGEAPRDSLDRFRRIRLRQELGWVERRAAKRDIKRLIDSMIAADLVEAGDEPRLIEYMNACLEKTSPRLWQMFCHWRRHHFGI